MNSISVNNSNCSIIDSGIARFFSPDTQNQLNSIYLEEYYNIFVAKNQERQNNTNAYYYYQQCSAQKFKQVLILCLELSLQIVINESNASDSFIKQVIRQMSRQTLTHTVMRISEIMNYSIATTVHTLKRTLNIV
ncbi:Hypothetical_protein [Hexamita inflata]|uniref:Hypothetical_protein n=1 Tax=Hexamita inflata TaxID=28002 RepID=A0AA86U6I0_9EUKA|nr:Hypothetical protein HINF_LOCUS30565 [Hexamita inflata]CAI9942924.1 Hypothetical protein HINF_LOCUS30569 [Hexamita inflata]CAI9942928.1 Hypothetical protein HINF_LOCUS30573 [Hexamita inflata]